MIAEIIYQNDFLNKMFGASVQYTERKILYLD